MWMFQNSGWPWWDTEVLWLCVQYSPWHTVILWSAVWRCSQTMPNKGETESGEYCYTWYQCFVAILLPRECALFKVLRYGVESRGKDVLCEVTCTGEVSLYIYSHAYSFFFNALSIYSAYFIQLFLPTFICKSTICNTMWKHACVWESKGRVYHHVCL
jgi:hypothetical protein